MQFSILVPVYNVEKYLPECLDSILNQTCQDFEVILVDDGSTDASGRICEKYTSKNQDKIRVIHQENGGLLCARRVGIANAKGDFCIFVDSDDFVEHSLLKSVSITISENSDVDVVLYSFRYYRKGKPAERFHPIAEDGKIWTGDEKHQLYEKLLFSNDVSAIWTKAVRTSLLHSDKTDYTKYYGKNMAEDVLQSLYILTAAQKIVYLDNPLYNYRILSDSITHTFNPQVLHKKNCLHVYEKELEYLCRWEMNIDKNRSRLAASFLEKVMYEFIHCYDNAKNNQEKCEVVNANWSSMVPKFEEYSIVEYSKPIYIYLYRKITDKNYAALRLFFIKRKIYSLWKKIRFWVNLKKLI